MPEIAPSARTESPDDRSAVKRCREILDEFSVFEVRPAGAEPFSLCEKLKRLPRTGKAVRIDRYGLGLPKQSLLDHIVMLSVMADIFGSVLGPDVDSRVVGEMAAFHDLAEVLIGDAPDFTDKELAAASHMTVEEKVLKEKTANDFLANQFTGELKDRFVKTLARLDDGRSPETEFFRMLDKCEPIISVWRYLHQFHDAICLENFLEAMTDFFANPKVAGSCVFRDASKLASFLQNKDQARKYYAQGPAALSGLQPNIFVPETLLALIEEKMSLV